MGTKTVHPGGVVIVRSISELPGQGINHASNGITKRVVLEYHDTLGNLTQIAESTYTPGAWFEAHTHADMDEYFRVISGYVDFGYGEGETLTLGPGDAIYFPAGVEHRGYSSGGAIVETVGVRARTDLDKGKNIPG